MFTMFRLIDRTMTLMVLVLILVVAFALPTQANDEVRLRAKAALLLTATPDGCGECRHDETDARAEATRRKVPLTVIVGKCDGAGSATVDAGGVPVVVQEYAGDKTPRVLILSPKEDGKGFWILHELKSPTDKEVEDAVRKAKPKKETAPPPVLVNSIEWYVNCPNCRKR